MQEVSFLGHLVTKDGVKKQPEKVQAIKDLPVPKVKDELHTFLGMCAWYQSFIPHFSTKAAPLYKLLGKRMTFTWTEEQQKSFDELKTAMCSDNILSSIDYRYPIVIKTDASYVGLGAILVQYIDGKEKVIHYASKLLQDMQDIYMRVKKNYWLYCGQLTSLKNIFLVKTFL